MKGIAAEIISDPREFLREGGAWDGLLRHSRCNTVFLSSAWLRAAWSVALPEDQIFAAAAWCQGSLVAATAMVRRSDVLQFLGTGSSDYQDIVVAEELSPDEAKACIAALLGALVKVASGVRAFVLRGIPVETGTLDGIWALPSPWRATQIHSMPAPSMDARLFEAAARKKSLRRHEKGLARRGEISVKTWKRPEDVLPRLATFFEQHKCRWASTPTPSQFHDSREEELYRHLTANLGAVGALRYTEVRLDDRLAAAHFGMFYGGVFTWYKPTFDPALARLSPGEVLLKNLIEQAAREGATEFDFTIGGEAFKKRFASHERTVVAVHLTRFFLEATRLRGWLALKRCLRRPLVAANLWEPLRRWRKVRIRGR